MATSWIIRFGQSVRVYHAHHLAEQFARALDANGTAYTFREL